MIVSFSLILSSSLFFLTNFTTDYAVLHPAQKKLSYGAQFFHPACLLYQTRLFDMLYYFVFESKLGVS